MNYGELIIPALIGILVLLSSFGRVLVDRESIRVAADRTRVKREDLKVETGILAVAQANSNLHLIEQVTGLSSTLVAFGKEIAELKLAQGQSQIEIATLKTEVLRLNGENELLRKDNVSLREDNTKLNGQVADLERKVAA